MGFLGEHEEKTILVLNKKDIRKEDFEYRDFLIFDDVSISCTTREGIGELTQKLVDRVLRQFDSNSTSVKIQSERHRQLLKMTQDSLISAKDSFMGGLGNELLAIDLRIALGNLGEIIGLTTSEDILNNIFSRFCIGK